ncbi:hypothetical protein D6851_01230 [Altericroceibacterium spongiae]|uniref:PDZ domain-containing protein n=1 Tax=Altericroceibacterium spongiae TaxID=2320269 RepID=A0A420ER37_9SPHN|nr:M48 family metalloprotease [Altericroceibacterium spongiae]RKF23147.1 hypothetical protein D6851_01230 [Altericroceibacterium spongiae]
MVWKYCLLASLILALSPAQAQSAPPAWPVVLQQQLARINEVEWRLGQVAKDDCPAQSAGFGWAIDHIAAYSEDDRALVRKTTGLGNSLQIIAIAPDSPAANADFHVNDQIQSINGVRIEKIFPEIEKDSLIADRFVAMIDQLPVDRPASFGVLRNGQPINIRVQPKKTCSARIFLKIKDGIDAYSDANGVALSTGFMQFTRNDDEVALIAGHELSHIILGDELDRKRIRGKKKEDAADKLGAHLALCAGYDVNLALDYWRRFDEQDWLGMFRSWDHRSAKSRLRMLKEFTQKDTC